MTEKRSALSAVRLEKAAVDCGFDIERSRTGDWLRYASTHAAVDIWLTIDDRGWPVVAVSRADVAAELVEFGDAASLRPPPGAVACRAVAEIPELHRLLRRTFQLARSLPDAMLHAFHAASAKLPRTTEAERLVVERVGQDVFRNGLLEYWDAKCAVTGLAIPELLRASHIKPWSECDSDAERLDVYNGLLLAPNLDAAFDRGFITVRDDGAIVTSTVLPRSAAQILGLGDTLRAGALSEHHLPYFRWHRAHVFKRSV